MTNKTISFDEILENVTAGTMTAEEAAKRGAPESWMSYEPLPATSAAYWKVLALVPKPAPTKIRTVSAADFAKAKAEAEKRGTEITGHDHEHNEI